MSRSVGPFVLAVVVLTAAGVVATAATDAGPPATARSEPVTPAIAAVYPNPIADGDAGEFVALSVPNGTDLDRYRLADDEGGVALPNRTVGGRVVLTGNVSRVPESVAGPVVEVAGLPELANAGERLTLADGSGAVDAVTYSDAPEGEVLRPAAARRWRPLGATAFEPVVGRGGTARAFTLPDSPGVPLELLRTADRRVLLAGYTLTSERVTDALLAAHERGVAVSVLVDGAPVGGLTNRSAAALDRLAEANVSVKLVGGPAARYRFHHAKYTVADDRAVVLTENWKPAGVGGASSRGWGVVVDSPDVVAGLVETFRADANWRAARPWTTVRRGESFEPVAPSRGQYPTRIDPESVPVERVELLVAPDNAAGRVEQLLGNATESIRVIQVSIGGREDPLLRAAVAAARRGVDVEILLSSAWYAREDNRNLTRSLRSLADREALPLSVRLAESGGRYEKIHAKGVVVDGDTVVVGSLNWNRNAYRENREVALVLHGEAVGSYFGAAFDRDWHGGVTRVPVGVVVVALLAVVLAGTVARKIRFER